MLINTISTRRNELMSQIGKTGLHIQFPDDFELYVCALELLDANNSVLRYFLFPVMPYTIDEQEVYPNNIIRTQGGITVLSTTAFIPKDITLTGTFGRRFKVLINERFEDIITDLDFIVKGTDPRNTNIFSNQVKTGYGSLRSLIQLLDDSKVVDPSGPRRLVLYNLAFGTSYIVEPINLKVNMNQDTNMLHQYNLGLKAIGRLSDFITASDYRDNVKNLLGSRIIQSFTSSVLIRLRQILPT